jgi:GNAT superfamily N-acetyltransferase
VNTELKIRPARAADHALLVEMNAKMARETEDKGLDEAALRRGVERALGDPDRGFYLVAERGDDAVGALLVTREWSDWRDAWFWWIQSVYVLPDSRRTGVYRALHDDVRDRARAAGDVCGIRLYVERANTTAKSTYVSMGMSASYYEMYEELLS